MGVVRNHRVCGQDVQQWRANNSSEEIAKVNLGVGLETYLTLSEMVNIRDGIRSKNPKN